jgi:hypothetical protein
MRLTSRLIASGVNGLRLGEVVLLEKPADTRSPKRIDCYQITEHSRLDPALLIYSLRWRHNAEWPDFELVLIQDEPAGWTANLTLLGALRRRAPDAIDWGPLFAAGVVQMLDDFEAARESRAARRH